MKTKFTILKIGNVLKMNQIKMKLIIIH